MCEKEHKESYIDIFRISNNEYIGNVHITLNLRAYNLLTEEFPLAEKYITPDKNNFFILNAPVCSFEGPARFVLGVFNNVNVHGDKNFIHFINEKIDIIKKI